MSIRANIWLSGSVVTHPSTSAVIAYPLSVKRSSVILKVALYEMDLKLSMKSDILSRSSSVGVGAGVEAVAGVTGIGDWVGVGDGPGVGVEVGTAFGNGMFEAAVGPSNTRGELVAVEIGCGVLVVVEAT